MAMATRKIQFVWVPEGTSPCWLARDACVRKFLADPSATHLLFLDDDMQVDEADLMKLLGSGHPCCAIAYRQKPPDGVLVEYTLDVDKWEPVGLDGFVDVSHVGAGALLVSRDVIEAMAAREPELAYETSKGRNLGLFRERVGPRFVGEDYAFCERVREAGHRVMVLVDAETDHVGEGHWPGNLRDYWPSIGQALEEYPDARNVEMLRRDLLQKQSKKNE